MPKVLAPDGGNGQVQFAGKVEQSRVDRAINSFFTCCFPLIRILEAHLLHCEGKVVRHKGGFADRGKVKTHLPSPLLHCKLCFAVLWVPDFIAKRQFSPPQQTTSFVSHWLQLLVLPESYRQEELLSFQVLLGCPVLSSQSCLRWWLSGCIDIYSGKIRKRATGESSVPAWVPLDLENWRLLWRWQQTPLQ